MVENIGMIIVPQDYGTTYYEILLITVPRYLGWVYLGNLESPYYFNKLHRYFQTLLSPATIVVSEKSVCVVFSSITQNAIPKKNSVFAR